MSKQILAYDLSDMMLQEAMQHQSNKLHFKQTFASVQKKLGACVSLIEKCRRTLKKNMRLSLSAGHAFRKLQFISEISVLYILCFASIPLAILWFNLLVN